ncbi:MAG: bifunctional 3,4-dihydroxy-2-butanone-4-phosphate synthase/GTP cyclohydrolase II [Polymorphum sp.]|uniref:3,4-dihydroxy-2-butanone 4-phosphate synthase n=1 Tax=Pannonibacter phragmitetus TaxID=121719 RepID=A0A0U3PFF9_9HYPH|nr:3,4-dihydroxy-2-butanone-4-phosphate synthase [Pannonibacter phragmitetus]ALV25949.1 3,4-dihydroxy-2-butanone 4-phosphate synthase [Pannonibacter phragmitetus]MBA4206542.1 bifunctional 3,4-dihydroxy-2-butanone-4-phosphate synthase/GTP cyclohydrolase II [Polymorphum sp.]
MRLDHWLAANGESRSAFARRAGLSPASVTALCNDPGAWVSRDMARKIAEATGGGVTPNDFLGLSITKEHPVSQARVAEAIRAFERGEMVVVTDDDDRENEGDLIVAATKVTPEQMAFIVRHTSGIVCAPMTLAAAKRLRLDPMVSNNDAPLSTAFTISVDYRHGLTTGISADERCATVRGLANPNAGPSDFVRPGHIFPLIAKEGGVLIRSGHTEAAVDLCRLAGLEQVGVISELVNDDGTVKRGAQVAEFAAEHDLKMVSVSDLIAWRQRTEKLIERVNEQPIQTVAGPAYAVTYSTPYDPMHHVAIVYGDILDGRSVPVRLQLESVLDDVFGAAQPLDAVMKSFADRGRGVIVFLREGSVGVARQSRRQRTDLEAAEFEEHGSAQVRQEQWREVGIGAQILKDLGVTSIRLLSSRERHYVGLEGFDIKIEATEILEA